LPLSLLANDSNDIILIFCVVPCGHNFRRTGGKSDQRSVKDSVNEEKFNSDRKKMRTETVGADDNTHDSGGLKQIVENQVMTDVKKIKLVKAPQVDTATSEALRYMAHTKQRRTYLPYTFPAVAGTHLRTLRGWRVE